MAKFGPYEIVEELRRSAAGSVLRVKDPAGAARVVKLLDTSQMGLLEADTVTQVFLDRAALQKSLADKGSPNWAAVYELKSTSDGGYYVTAEYPFTARRLIAGRTQLDARTLDAIVTGVVKGLLALKMSHRRGHGNLSSGNVLLAAEAQKLTVADVFLTDPADGGEFADDIKALGELIHQLVTFRPFSTKAGTDAGSALTLAAGKWPLPDSPDWARLGPSAAGWRELCSRLLSPNPAAGIGQLEEVAAVLQTLRPRPTKKKARKGKRRLAALTAVLLITGAGVGAGGIMLHRSHSVAKSELAELDAQWFTAFEKALQDPIRRQIFSADPELRAVFDEIDRGKTEHGGFDPADNPTLSWPGYQRTRAAIARVDKIRQMLTPEQWKALGEMVELQKRYDARHWSDPAKYLLEMNRATQPVPAADVAGGIERLLRSRPKLLADAAALESAWTKLDADLKPLEATKDPVLLAFADYFRSGAAVLVHAHDDRIDGADDLRAMLPDADALASVVAKGWPQAYGRDRLARDVESALNTVKPRQADIRAWLDAVGNYELANLPDDSEQVAALKKGLAKVVAEMVRQPWSAEERAPFEPARAALDAKIQDFKDTRFIRKEIANGQGELAVRWSALQRELAAMRKQWIKIEDPLEWLAAVDEPLPVTSDQVKARWKSWVAAIRPKAAELAADQKLFVATKKTTEDVKAALSALDENFPAVPLGLSESFAAVAWEKREKALADLSKWAVPGQGTPMPTTQESVQPVADAFALFAGHLKSLAKDFPITKEVLLPEDRPDLKWAKEVDFWKDSAVQRLVAADLQRIAALAAVEDSMRAEVIAAARDATKPEIALAAWRRLGRAPDASGAVIPAWPTRPGELEAELQLRTHVAALIKEVKTETVRTTVTAELAAQGPERWRRFASIAPPEALGLTSKLRSSFGVNEVELAKLDPPARFNLAVYVTRLAATEGTQAAIRNALEELNAAAGGLRERPQVAELLARVGRINDPEPMAAALAGQAPEKFQLGIKDSQYTIQFVRVTAPGVRPFYLATTEVSLGAFIDLVNARGSWADANLLLGNYPNPPAVRGPQAWGRPGAANLPIVRWDTWRVDGGRPFDLAKPLRQPPGFNRYSMAEKFGGDPSELHPMQQIPAQAAIYAAASVGCRLPSSREWLAAYEIEKKAAGNVEWNLRDLTWRTQLDYQAQVAQSQWPDATVAGIFRPAVSVRSGAEPAPIATRDSNDGTLFFRKVDSPTGTTFLNLVGNVAEFLCDAPESSDILARQLLVPVGPGPAARPAEAVTSFAKTNASRLAVIGGSALSDPAADVTKPYPAESPFAPYADVGFRVAFTAPAATAAERLRWFLEDQPYLPVGPGR